MKTLRCTASPSLVIRDVPAGIDTGKRIPHGEAVTAYGESYDGQWEFVRTPSGSGWASAKYLEAATIAPPPSASLSLVTRNAWGAVGGTGSPAAGMLGLVVIHHFGADPGEPQIPPTATPAQEAAAIRGIERFHVSPKPAGRGWSGIGYNFLFCPSGRAYEGRGWRRVGAHSDGENSSSLGICFCQDGDRMRLTPEQIAAVRLLLTHGVAAKHLAEDFRILGHRATPGAATQCPGNLIFAQVGALRP